MKITTLPSGSIRIQVYTHSEWEILPDGTKKEHKKFKSFTSKDTSAKGRKKLIAQATQYQAEKDSLKDAKKTLNAGLKEYVDARKNVFSASTVREYSRYVKNGIPYIGDKYIDSITQEDVQRAINQFTVGHEPKTVKNFYSIISAVITTYRPSMVLRTKLPQIEKKPIYIPTDEEVKKVLKAAEGTDMEIPILLAAFGPMRRGEICALRYENIDGIKVHVCEAMAKSTSKFVVKPPKSVSSDRYIEFPESMREKLSGTTGRVVQHDPTYITNSWERQILPKAGVKPFRFHDLRHWCISTLHDLGIPDADIILRSGHSSVAILEQVYLHAKSERIKEMNEKANSHFNSMIES